MRILHTSDWHLGRSLHGLSLLGEQREVVARVVELTESEGVDVVVIAGDLYDRAIPPVEAVDVWGDALVALHETGATVVAISGNHDSPVRVGVDDRILAAGVAVRGDVGRVADPVLVDSTDGGAPLAIYAVPFLEPSLVHGKLVTEADDAAPTSCHDGGEHRDGSTRSRRPTHDQVTRLALGRVRDDLEERGEVRSLVVAHTFVSGGTVSESERELSVGNVDQVALDAFQDFDYVALGHLHRSQQFDGGRVAYSGSPLAYSFSEEGNVKSVRLVDLDPTGSTSSEVIALDIGRQLCTIRGTLHELLESPEHAHAEQARVRAIITDPHMPTQPMARLRERFGYALELRHEPPEAPGGEVEGGRREVESVSPMDLTLRFWTDQQGAEANGEEQDLLHQALAAVSRSDEL